MRLSFKKVLAGLSSLLLAVAGVTSISAPSNAALPGTVCPTGTTASGAVPAVELISQPMFYTGLGDGYNSNYIGYTIKNGSSAQSNLYVELRDFTGNTIALAANQPASQPSGPVAAGGSVTTFFLATANALPQSNVTHSHNVVLWNGNPALGGTEICGATTTFQANPAYSAGIAASANKVDTITVGQTTGLTLGGTVEVTVRGDTGTIFNSGPSAISLSPASSSNFPAGAWRLVSTSIRLNLTNAYANKTGTVTYTNRTYMTSQAVNAGNYEAVYTFKAVSTATASAAIIPIQYVNSGANNMKYTGTLPSTPSLLPIVNNSITMAKSSTQTQALAATTGSLDADTDICYTIDLYNSASIASVVDQIADVHPAGSTYVSGSAVKANSAPSCSSGTAVTPLVQTSAHRLVFEGPLEVPAGGHLYLSYQIRFPAGLAVAVYNNSATAYISSTTLGASSYATILVGTPPTYTVTFDANGGTGAKSAMTQTAPGSSIDTSDTPTRTNYTFGGYTLSTDGVDLLPRYIVPSSNMTVYAKWIPVLYTVSFDLLGGSGNSTSLTQATAGGTVQMYATGVTKSGYSFGGWASTSGGTTALPYAQTPTSNYTVYAIWVAQLVVSFDLLGGTGTSTSVSPANVGGSVSLWQGAVKTGYTFGGWALTSGGTSAISDPYTPSATITVYAIWTANAPAPAPTPTVLPAPTVFPSRATTVTTTPVTVTPSIIWVSANPGTSCLDIPETRACGTSYTVAGKGTFVVNANGSVTFSAAPGFIGEVSMWYRVVDRNGQDNQALVTITVTKPELPAAPVVGPASGTTVGTTPITLSPSVTYPPGQGTPSLCLVDPADNVCKQSVTLPGKGTFTLNSNGTVSFVAAPGFVGTATVQLRATDAFGQSSEAPITVVVTKPAAPVVEPSGGTTLVNQPINVKPNVTWPASYGTPSLCLVDPADNVCKQSVTLPGKGTFTLNSDGTVTFVPAKGFIGEATVQLRATDQYGQSSEAPITVRVTDVPSSQNGSTKGATPVVLAPEKPLALGSEVCLVDPNDQQCKTVVTIAGAGTWTQQANGSVKFAPVAGYVGKVTVMQRITRGASLPRLSPYTVVVAKKRGPVTITISGFADGSPVLTAAIKAKINAFLKAYSDYKNVTCIGYTEGPTVLATDAALSKQRALNACGFVKAGLGKSLKVAKISAGQDTIEAAQFRRITITLND